MKTMCPPGYHHSSFTETHATVDHVPKCMFCHRTIVVITRRAHCFHDCMYITPILLRQGLSTHLMLITAYLTRKSQEPFVWYTGNALTIHNNNISKRINTLSADETTFNEYKDLYNNALAETDLNIRLPF